MKKLLSIIGIWAALTSAFAAKGQQPRLQTQTSQVFGDVGSNVGFTFNKTRKNVLSALLKVNTTYQWNFVSVSAPRGDITFNFQNSISFLGITDTASSTVTILGANSLPFAYTYQDYVEVNIDPNLLEGVGTLSIPIVTTGNFSYNTSNFVVLNPQFISTAVLEYTTGR